MRGELPHFYLSKCNVGGLPLWQLSMVLYLAVNQSLCSGSLYELFLFINCYSCELDRSEKYECSEYFSGANSSWLGRQDSNLRITGPKPVALPLGYDPKLLTLNIFLNKLNRYFTTCLPAIS